MFFPDEPERTGDLKFGDKCNNTPECGFRGSTCLGGICVCRPDLPVTNHVDKCGKGQYTDEYGAVVPQPLLQYVSRAFLLWVSVPLMPSWTFIGVYADLYCGSYLVCAPSNISSRNSFRMLVPSRGRMSGYCVRWF